MLQPTEKMQKWRKLSEYWSGRTGCPAALILAVIQQESGGNPNAVRFERGYLDKYGGTAKFRNICKTTGYETEDVATSYGLMQLMLPLSWGYMSDQHKTAQAKLFLLVPENNIRYGSAHLSMLIKKYTLYDANHQNHKLDAAEIRCVAGAYNGGGLASAYARNVSALYVRYDKWLRGVE